MRSSNMHIKIVKLAVLPKGDNIFSERCTFVGIEDEGGGEFVVVSQSCRAGEQSIAIDQNEWPELCSAISYMIKQCEDHNNRRDHDKFAPLEVEHEHEIYMDWTPLTERIPNPEEYDRVLIYTQGRDFSGEQVFDVKAETLNECMYEAQDDQPEVCKHATHWTVRPDF